MASFSGSVGSSSGRARVPQPSRRGFHGPHAPKAPRTFSLAP